MKTFDINEIDVYDLSFEDIYDLQSLRKLLDIELTSIIDEKVKQNIDGLSEIFCELDGFINYDVIKRVENDITIDRFDLDKIYGIVAYATHLLSNGTIYVDLKSNINYTYRLKAKTLRSKGEETSKDVIYKEISSEFHSSYYNKRYTLNTDDLKRAIRYLALNFKLSIFYSTLKLLPLLAYSKRYHSNDRGVISIEVESAPLFIMPIHIDYTVYNVDCVSVSFNGIYHVSIDYYKPIEDISGINVIKDADCGHVTIEPCFLFNEMFFYCHDIINFNRIKREISTDNSKYTVSTLKSFLKFLEKIFYNKEDNKSMFIVSDVSILLRSKEIPVKSIFDVIKYIKDNNRIGDLYFLNFDNDEVLKIINGLSAFRTCENIVQL